MNVNQYQKYHKNTRNMKKGILASNIGALPILQESTVDLECRRVTVKLF